MHFRFGYVDLSVYDPVRKADFLVACREGFGTTLENHGFAELAPGSWRRAAVPDVVELFQLQALRGLSQGFVWGLSLSFVPHIGRSGRVEWHKTAKRAQLDLRFDPLDHFARSSEWMVPLGHGLDAAKSRSAWLFHKCWPMAREFFASSASPDLLVGLFQVQASAPTVRFGFENYPQQMLAYAFALKRVGLRQLAETWLDRYIRCCEMSEVLAGELTTLLEAD